jgi:hypothetical protein
VLEESLGAELFERVALVGKVRGRCVVGVEVQTHNSICLLLIR